MPLVRKWSMFMYYMAEAVNRRKKSLCTPTGTGAWNNELELELTYSTNKYLFWQRFCHFRPSSGIKEAEAVNRQ